MNISRDNLTNGTATVARISAAASPVVHRVLLSSISTLDASGVFEMSVAGVVTRPVSVDASAVVLQNVIIIWR